MSAPPWARGERLPVAVVGGAMVGLALACALAARGVEVVVIEAREAPPEPPARGFDLRVSALSRASQCLLERLGVWSGLAAPRLGPFREMRVWDREAGAEIHFDAADVGLACLGHIVENSLVQGALERRAAGLGVAWHRPAVLETLEVGERDVRLGLAGGGRVRASLVVGADGARSRVRELAGFEVREADYGQDAVVANLVAPAGHRETAWQRFLPSGPLALLPLPGDTVSIVWSTGRDAARELLEMPPATFAHAVTEASEGRLGDLVPAGPRAAFTLARRHARRYVGPRVALVGDAAHVVHPLAGQGGNLGLLDAAALAEVVLAAAGRGRDPGHPAWLRRYERWRRGHNLAMSAVMDAFDRGFRSRAAPVRLARGLGLALTERAPPAKRWIMRLAAGLEGDLPALARPGPLPD